MPIKDGTGPSGKGPMTGRGSGKCIIPLNTRKEEISFLINREKVLRGQLGQIEKRIGVLQAPGHKEKKVEDRDHCYKS